MATVYFVRLSVLQDAANHEIANQQQIKFQS